MSTYNTATNAELLQRIRHLRNTQPALLGHIKYDMTLLMALLHHAFLLVSVGNPINREPVALALLATGHAKPEHKCSQFGSALLIACQCKYNKLAKALLDLVPPTEYGVKGTLSGDTILMTAIRERMEDVAVRLVESGQSHPEYVNSSSGQTALILACQQNIPFMVSLLLFTGHADPGHANMSGDTALIVACRNNMEDTVNEMLDLGDSIKPKHANRDQGQTALIVSAERGHHNLMKLLLKPSISNIMHKDRNGNTALYYLLRHFLARPLSDLESVLIFRDEIRMHMGNIDGSVIQILCQKYAQNNPKVYLLNKSCERIPVLNDFMQTMCTPPVETEAKVVNSPTMLTARRKLKLQDLQRSMVRRTRKKTPPRADRVAVDRTARPVTPETYITFNNGRRMPKPHPGNDYPPPTP